MKYLILLVVIAFTALNSSAQERDTMVSENSPYAENTVLQTILVGAQFNHVDGVVGIVLLDNSSFTVYKETLDSLYNDYENFQITLHIQGTGLTQRFRINGGELKEFNSDGSYIIQNFDVNESFTLENVRTSNETSDMMINSVTITATKKDRTGINETSSNKLNIYPNPATNTLFIDNCTGYFITVNNTLGQIVYNQPITSQQASIDLSLWSGKGLYFINLIDTNNNIIETRKILLK